MPESSISSNFVSFFICSSILYFYHIETFKLIHRIITSDNVGKRRFIDTKTMRLTHLFVAFLLVSNVSIVVLASFKFVDGVTKETTFEVCLQEDLLKKMFLFGRVHTLLIDEQYSTIKAINLRIVFFKPFQFLHYTRGEEITFLNPDKGVSLAGKFVVGFFDVVLPINTNSIAVIDTTSGKILVELYEDKMPNTTRNFIQLAEDGFYDGLVFHRVIDNFMIQGGGYYPNGTEKISPYGPIDLEVHPEIHHLDGTLGMARTSDPNSATSQFFINDGRQRHLEPGGVDPYGYAAFGRVVKDIDVVRAIAKVETMTKYGVMQNWPVEDIVIEKIAILRPADVTITDHVGDVISIDYLTGETSIVTNSAEIVVENLDIIMATYWQQGIQAVLRLQVIGNIENRGKPLDPGNISDVIDIVEYDFRLSTSKQEYLLCYSNRTGTLSYGDIEKNLTSDQFMVVGETLSIRFFLMSPEEQYDSLSVASTFIKVNFSNPVSTFLYFSDIVPTPPLEVLISVPNIGYVGEPVQFNATVLPLTGLPPYSYLWEFGDENTSTQLNPTHIYYKEGVYSYTFTATDSLEGTVNASGTITINASGKGWNAFVFRKTTGGSSHGDFLRFETVIPKRAFLCSASLHSFFL